MKQVKRIIQCNDCNKIILEEIVPKEMLEKLPKHETCPFCNSTKIAVSIEHYIEVDMP